MKLINSLVIVVPDNEADELVSWFTMAQNARGEKTIQLTLSTGSEDIQAEFSLEKIQLAAS